ncbi:MAG: PTS transporter subunit EIIC [Limosilactobacillus sp.]|uniref:PTS transporter subunit EIIC n=1 Tax=Limosilactobacillus sp. TaxID=2773925 RepID=UPI00271161DB|nr:PTS transporter subunit EIIC [Limosilactobacillus sp.]
MVTLFPIVLIGCIASLLSNVLFSENGFLGSILYINKWMPFRNVLRDIFSDISTVSIGYIATYAAYVSANLTVRRYKDGIPTAGLTALVAYLLIFQQSLRSSENVIDMRFYTANWFIFGLLVGYLVGKIFVRFGKHTGLNDFNLNSAVILKSTFANFRPILISLGAAFVIHLLFIAIRSFYIDTTITMGLSTILNNHSNYAMTLLISLVETVLSWLGFAESLRISNDMFSSEFFENLSYALTHRSIAHVPYPFTPAALYNGYGQFGGCGVALALIIAILWVSHHRNSRSVAKASSLPVFFNSNMPLIFGAVVMLNPIYVLPFIFLPIVNMLLASVLIMLHILPAIVYMVPNGTPGILTPLIGTGGDFWAVLWSVMFLILDVALYIPFVKLADKCEDRVQAQRKAGEQNEGN